MFTKRLLQLCAFGTVALPAVIEARGEKLPLVDLGYAVHRPSFNPDNEQYAFRNIRYADPPVGERRFRAPVPISTINRTLNDGSHGFECRQAWTRESIINDWAEEAESPEDANERLINYPGFNEDCLFLNVIVPKKVLEKRKKSCKGEKAPVIVWIHGGGYSQGWKEEPWTAPDGLVERSQLDGSDGVVYVAINYRLGIFGFFAAHDKRIDLNAGLLDQNLALQWVQENIHLFGGDPENVTVMGESSGAGSIAYHLTAHGGKARPNFHNAVMQSIEGKTVYVDQLEEILQSASEISGRTISNADDLASMSDEDLTRVNALHVFNAPLGGFTFGPQIDGDYVQNWPAVHLREGQFDRSPRLMLSHTANETIKFLPEEDWGGENNEDQLRFLIFVLVGALDESVVQYALEELYPPPSERTAHMYYSNWGRALLLGSDITFNCGADHFARAWDNATYNWVLSVGEGWHGQDVGYVFYNGTDNAIDPGAAYVIQTYIAQMARTGNPNGESSELPMWPLYGDDGNQISIVEGGAEVIVNIEGATERCAYWQKHAGTGEAPRLTDMKPRTGV